jgi:glucose-6-phosphate-specific signal transduction histidine kinase
VLLELFTTGRGFGLTGIAERVRMLGGSHVVTSSPGQGTTLAITLQSENRGNQGHDASYSAI